MADFCRDCADDVWGDPDLNDFWDICEEDEFAIVLCEGCGLIVVDHTGKRVRKVEFE